jgi:hypothetical protein
VGVIVRPPSIIVASVVLSLRTSREPAASLRLSGAFHHAVVEVLLSCPWPCRVGWQLFLVINRNTCRRLSRLCVSAMSAPRRPGGPVRLSAVAESARAEPLRR